MSAMTFAEFEKFCKKFKNTRVAELQHRLPYGMWTCSDGREVLFNRSYQPIWERYPGKPAKIANPEWIDWEKEKFFFNDWNSPWGKRKGWANSLRKCENILKKWGVA